MKRECRCGTPTTGAWLCERCETTFRYALVNVAAYYADLETVATKRARMTSNGATKGSIGKAQPLPVDARFLDVTQPVGAVTEGRATLSPATQVRWDTWNTVVAWCRTVMEDQPELAGPAHVDCLDHSCNAIRRRRWPANRVTSMVNYLARQFRFILGERWCEDMLDEFLDLERRLRRLIDRGPDRWYAGKCWVEDEHGTCMTELYATTDRGTVVCEGCGITHDVAERRDVLLAEAKEYLVTATEAAGALMAWTDYEGTEVNLIKRISKWRDREKLEVADVTSLMGQDRHLYRLGDIQALMIEDAQRQQTRRIDA